MKPDLPVEVSGQQTLGIFRRYFKKPAYPQEGSVTGNGQFSNYVRGKMDLECNGQTNDPGHLRDFDLKPFRGNRLLPNNVRDKVLEWTDGDKDVCLRLLLPDAKAPGVADHPSRLGPDHGVPGLAGGRAGQAFGSLGREE